MASSAASDKWRATEVGVEHYSGRIDYTRQPGQTFTFKSPSSLRSASRSNVAVVCSAVFSPMSEPDRMEARYVRNGSSGQSRQVF